MVEDVSNGGAAVKDFGRYEITFDREKSANDIHTRLDTVNRDVREKFGVEMVILKMRRTKERELYVMFGWKSWERISVDDVDD